MNTSITDVIGGVVKLVGVIAGGVVVGTIVAGTLQARFAQNAAGQEPSSRVRRAGRAT